MLWLFFSFIIPVFIVQSLKEMHLPGVEHLNQKPVGFSSFLPLSSFSPAFTRPFATSLPCTFTASISSAQPPAGYITFILRSLSRRMQALLQGRLLQRG